MSVGRHDIGRRTALEPRALFRLKIHESMPRADLVASIAEVLGITQETALSWLRILAFYAGSKAMKPGIAERNAGLECVASTELIFRRIVRRDAPVGPLNTICAADVGKDEEDMVDKLRREAIVEAVGEAVGEAMAEERSAALSAALTPAREKNNRGGKPRGS